MKRLASFRIAEALPAPFMITPSSFLLRVGPLAAVLLATLVTATPVSYAADQAVAPLPPPTLMTTAGSQMVNQQFEAPLPPFDGKSNGFASGFKAWRYNSAARGGHWDVINGTFHGSEKLEAKHPATASYGFIFKDVVVSCEVCMHSTPLAGRPAHRFSIRTTDTKDYVCGLSLSETGLTIEKSDNDHGGPDKPVMLGQWKTPIPLETWQKIVIEILGDEMVVTLNGKSLTGQHPLIASEKHSIMFVSGGDGSVRNFKVWSATPNPSWPKNKQTLTKG